MSWKTDCAAVIPCLNEAEAIGSVVAGVLRHVAMVCVVDDGSSDDTARAARQAGATVLSHAEPRGKGAALNTGWRFAREGGFRWAMTLDGDGQHSPDDLPAFFKVAERTGADLVVGNRMSDPKGMPWQRRWVNRWMSSRLSNFTGCSMPDTQCGFRLMNLDTWAAARVATVHFEIESELLLAFATAGREIAFVPIAVIYGSERSKIHPWRDTLRWFRWWRQVRRTLNVRCPEDSSRPAGSATRGGGQIGDP